MVPQFNKSTQISASCTIMIPQQTVDPCKYQVLEIPMLNTAAAHANAPSTKNLQTIVQ